MYFSNRTGDLISDITDNNMSVQNFRYKHQPLYYHTPVILRHLLLPALKVTSFQALLPASPHGRVLQGHVEKRPVCFTAVHVQLSHLYRNRLVRKDDSDVKPGMT